MLSNTYILFCWSLFNLAIGSAFGQQIEVSKARWSDNDDEFSAVVCGDSILFCARKRTEVFGLIEDADGNYQTNLFSIPKNSKSSDEAKLMFVHKDRSINFGPTSGCSPDGSFWMTVSKDNGKKKSSTTGIYQCNSNKIENSDLGSFPFNDTTGTYEVGHPFVSFDGLHLYFSSDMPGGYGGKDIYVCHKENANSWSKPVNLGQAVNGSSDEISPFMAATGYLYFASNRNGESFDLFEVSWLNEIFGDATTLPEPINSSYNEFGLSFDNSGKIGLFTSDRSGNLDIYELVYDFPRFDNCEPIHETNFCYLFEDLSIQRIDTLPMRFEWDFGDGHKAGGLVAEHCYDNVGTYVASLSVIDTITNLLYAKVSEVEVVIEKFRRPYILSDEVSSVGKPIQFTATTDDVTDFIPSNYYWFFGDGTKLCNKSVSHTYGSPGLYTITLGVLADEKQGKMEKVCATKQLYIIDPAESVTPEEVEPDTLAMEYPVVSQEYYVELMDSDVSVALSDSVFSLVKHEITERYQTTSGQYIYTVGNAKQYTDLVGLYYEMRDCGFDQAVVKDETIDSPQSLFVKKGWYISDSKRKQIHSDLYKFRNILFENNSADLVKESKLLLDEIAQVMNNEVHFRVHIVAHTDDQGDELYNLELSKNRAECVRNYLIAKGIPADRLTCEGMGESAPLVANGTEEGKAQNRRVEFQVLFENIYGEFEE